ncbi:ETC complex I subunit [Lacibacterium aquatile]|uniref:ETC complex I subunit n=1 Tax=Lacibacterium aquatile TaxID=1168082 RepID=A0ABW5DNN0_9PROT
MSQQVRIYRPAKTAMQSGKGRTKDWVLEFEPGAPRTPEPLIGWVSGSDTRSQLRLSFDTKEDAVAYAQRHSLIAVIEDPQPSKFKAKSYADNFRPERIRF